MPEGFEVFMAEFQQMKAQLAQLQVASRIPAAAEGSGDLPMSPDSDQEEDADPSWSDILRQKRRQATGEEAAKFARLLETAPDLQALKDSRGDVALYMGVPEAPGPRRNRVDGQLFQAQVKVELGLHLMTHYLETGNKAALGGAAAWQRSAWQDLQEQRRQFLAGREAWKLERRKDDKTVKLLTDEEDKKIGKFREKPAGKGERGRFRDSQPAWARRDWASQDQGSWRDQSRARSNSNGKGKGFHGKGKGSGRGRYQK